MRSASSRLYQKKGGRPKNGRGDVIALSSIQSCLVDVEPLNLGTQGKPITIEHADYLKRADGYERLAEEALDPVLAAVFRTSAKNCRATAERISELEEVHHALST